MFPERPRFENDPTQGNVIEQSQEKSAKEVAWEKQRQEIENSADTLGYKIDEQIKESLVAFNLVGLPTSASCEGHVDHGISAPWIEVSAPNQPEERFFGENEIFQKVAEKYGIQVEDMKRMANPEANRAYWEAVGEASCQEETPEYRHWREETQKLIEKASGLLEEFYRNREVPPGIKLEISEGGEGEFRVCNGGEDYRPVPEDLTDEEKKQLAQRLVKYQAEMKEFTAFLKDKYFSENA